MKVSDKLRFIAEQSVITPSGNRERIARCADIMDELYEALAIFMNEWDGYGENEHGYSDDVSGVMNDAWKNGFISKARAALSRARGDTQEADNG